MQRFTLDRSGLAALIESLQASGHRVLGPTIRSDVIRFAEIGSIDDLPRGWTMRLGPGTARLERRQDDALFGYVVGPNGLKEILFPPRRVVWNAVSVDGRVRFEPGDDLPIRTAVLGARPCDLAAAAVHDRVFLGGTHRDRDYETRRDTLFIVAVNCTTSAPTCFCTSLGTGPSTSSGFDLALTEVLDRGRHFFLGEVGSEAGDRMLETVPHTDATTEEITLARFRVAKAAAAITRRLDTRGLRELLASSPLSGRWNAIAERCLACGNCTQVCPTCFCVDTEDTVGLDGTTVRTRRWDSCFSLDFSFMGGRPMRASIGARYRQWLTHKLSTWIDQFGLLGCVGCGRCIVWCPVGIDLTEEVAEMRALEATHA